MAERKLNQEKADTIRQRFRAGTPGKVLAHEFNVRKSTVSMIVNDQIWKGKSNERREARDRHIGVRYSDANNC